MIFNLSLFHDLKPIMDGENIRNFSWAIDEDRKELYRASVESRVWTLLNVEPHIKTLHPGVIRYGDCKIFITELPHRFKPEDYAVYED